MELLSVLPMNKSVLSYLTLLTGLRVFGTITFTSHVLPKNDKISSPHTLHGTFIFFAGN